MPRTEIELLLYLMDEAFRDHQFHSLMNNVKGLHDDDWEWLAPDGVRTILHIVEHVGGYKFLYEDQAFGDRSLSWERLFVPNGSSLADRIPWLQEGHENLRASVAALADDDELKQNRMAPWGGEANTRWIVNNMVQHDLYHAGEINHIRALHQRDDA